MRFARGTTRQLSAKCKQDPASASRQKRRSESGDRVRGAHLRSGPDATAWRRRPETHKPFGRHHAAVGCHRPAYWRGSCDQVAGPGFVCTSAYFERYGDTIGAEKAVFPARSPKNYASVRTIHLLEWATEMLLRRKKNASPTRTDAVFATRNGTFVTPSNTRTELKNAMAKSGIEERITPHAFRRTVATAVAENVNDEAAAAQLGHASVEVTRAHYIVRPKVVPNYSEFLANMAAQIRKE